ncbi:hypothetical protein [Clavibacter sepedonicus]|uniref:hypothetical protein n=1 Tax=Clavibacter sepedonicus TaxID=31964 RepID=UPI001FF0D7DC|nr:hypothetical protein [Clavibacter sepedonicus]
MGSGVGAGVGSVVGAGSGVGAVGVGVGAGGGGVVVAGATAAVGPLDRARDAYPPRRAVTVTLMRAPASAAVSFNVDPVAPAMATPSRHQR